MDAFKTVEIVSKILEDSQWEIPLGPDKVTEDNL